MHVKLERNFTERKKMATTSPHVRNVINNRHRYVKTPFLNIFLNKFILLGEEHGFVAAERIWLEYFKWVEIYCESDKQTMALVNQSRFYKVRHILK